eukprot:3430125-Amphidinium_carterae.1
MADDATSVSQSLPFLQNHIDLHFCGSVLGSSSKRLRPSKDLDKTWTLSSQTETLHLIVEKWLAQKFGSHV